MVQNEQDEGHRKTQKEFQAWAHSMIRNGLHVSMKDSSKRISQVSPEKDTLPNPDYNWFSPAQMHCMVNFPFEKGCPVQLRALTKEQVFKIPFMRQAFHLLYALKKNDIRLTSNGYLPVDMVEELFVLGTNGANHYVRSLETISESKVEDVNMLHIALEHTGLVRKCSNKLSLTEKGHREFSQHNDLLLTIITYLFSRFNTGWKDLHEDSKIGNTGRIYSLWLLHHYGDKWRNFEFYQNEYFKAFPTLVEQITRTGIRIPTGFSSACSIIWAFANLKQKTLSQL